MLQIELSLSMEFAGTESNPVTSIRTGRSAVYA